MSQENVETVQRAFEAWNRGDIEGYVAHLCSDVEGVPVGAALEGKVYWQAYTSRAAAHQAVGLSE